MSIPEIFLDVKNEKHDGFRVVPFIVMFLLILGFMASVVYVLVASMNA